MNIVSIPQAVSAVATYGNDVHTICLLCVSIPQAVSAVATINCEEVNDSLCATFQYRKR